jgi:site-specific DNA-methyltransferase (adenine-specific)
MELNKIYCESNLETMARMPDNFIDLVVTSPPYDGLRTYNGYSFPFEDIAKELFRVTKQGGVVVWVVGDSTINGSESLTSFKQALYFVEKCGFNLHDTMIYQKDVMPFPESTRYNQCFEYMFILSKGKQN